MHCSPKNVIVTFNNNSTYININDGNNKTDIT